MAYAKFMFRKGRFYEKAQGLVEYALIMILVAMVVIAAAALFGQEVRASYCKIVVSVDPSAEPPGCNQLAVACVIQGTPPGNLTWEASVDDSVGEDDVDYVQFYVDGTLAHSESRPRYCFISGDSACNPFSPSMWGSGQHNLVAIAYDKEGNMGRCSTSITVP